MYFYTITLNKYELKLRPEGKNYQKSSFHNQFYSQSVRVSEIIFMSRNLD